MNYSIQKELEHFIKKRRFYLTFVTQNFKLFFKMKRNLLFLLLFIANHSFAQQTVGVFQNDSVSYNGYTLLFPNTSKTTYLIDNCGNVVHQWESEYNPGLVAYLLDNGDLLRTGRIGSNFNGGGSGGRIERFNWEGELIWSYNHTSQDFHQHHDIEYLPNGNILIIAWERHTVQEALDLGRNPLTLSNDEIWSEQIVEIQPEGEVGGEIIWEWHLWDHMIQDFDSLSNNYGDVAQHPELMDINAGNSGVDWIHLNAVDYNPELDQIVMSSRHLNEIYIIDHSTTTEEAATPEGGNSGKGGNFLYRWGNPMQYKRGAIEDRKLFGQHDAQWIEPDRPGAGELMVFNNGIARPEGSFSTIDVWSPPLLADGNYLIDSIEAFGPTELSWTFVDDPDNLLFSSNISGAQRLPNGNTLICEGRTGDLIEVMLSGLQVWRYVSPVVGGGIVTQGDNVSNNNVFRAYRYGVDFPAFADVALVPSDPIELEPTNQNCVIYGGPVSTTDNLLLLDDVNVLNNPIDNQLFIENRTQEMVFFEMIDVLGRLVLKGQSGQQLITQDVGELNAGIYWVQIFNENRNRRYVEKVVKR
ncbi:MAG: hypothetical protein ACI9XO_002399 [Paraglaciecola sp.]